MQKFTQLSETFIHNHPHLPIYLLSLMMLGMFIFLLYVVYNTVKYEKVSKEFRKNIKVGDKAYFSCQGFDSIVTNPSVMEGDVEMVEVKLLLRKDRVYKSFDSRYAKNPTNK